ncbi:E3 ubiquitin protein ligase UPL1-like protein, partial [Tanacetum coccineum]
GHYLSKTLALLRMVKDETGATNTSSNANGIDPTFLEALPADLRAEVLASQQAQSVPAPFFAPACWIKW